MSAKRIPVDALEAICRQVDGDCGLFVSIPETGETFSRNGDMVFHAASTIKIPVLALLAQDAEAGRADWEKKLVVKPENRVVGSGILQSLSPDMELSLLDLAVLMMVLSDNTATNECIDAVGMDRVRQFCTDNGFHNTWLWRKMFFKGYMPPPQIPEDMPSNATTANDLGRMLEGIADGSLIGETAGQRVVQIMAGQRLNRLKTLLPFVDRVNPRVETLKLPPEGKVVAATKSGSLGRIGIAHDAGIFYLPDGRYYVMAMCTRSSSVQEGSKRIGEASLVMYRAMQ